MAVRTVGKRTMTTRGSRGLTAGMRLLLPAYLTTGRPWGPGSRVRMTRSPRVGAESKAADGRGQANGTAGSFERSLEENLVDDDARLLSSPNRRRSTTRIRVHKGYLQGVREKAPSTPAPLGRLRALQGNTTGR